jgi:hypothetical protein
MLAEMFHSEEDLANAILLVVILLAVGIVVLRQRRGWK